MPITYSPFTKVDDVLFNICRHTDVHEIPFHDHAECIEITVVMDGTAIHHADGRNQRIQRGDCLVTLLGGLHAFSECRELELYTVSCTTDEEKFAGLNLNFLYGMRDLLTGRNRTIAFYLNRMEYNDVRQMLCQMEESQNTASQSELRSRFAILLCLLAQAYARTLSTGVRQNRLEKALDYLEAHYKEELDLDSLAMLSAMSKSHFIRLFHNSFGSTPIGYQLELRLLEAQRLLRTTTLSILEISDQLGFHDSNYFSHFFKQKTGSSPRAFRQKEQ